MNPSGLGERDIIKLITRRFKQSKQKLPLGFDDDVSAYPMSRRKWLVVKTDTLVGSSDIPPGMSLEQAARKAVVATVSDFAAKGVKPSGLLISLELKPPVSPATALAISRGIHNAAREYGCSVIGGDTGESSDLVIDCVGFGFARADRVMRRNGAKRGDIIAVTGYFGKTAAGLKILLSKKKTLSQEFPRLVQSVIRPKARLKTGLRLTETGMVNSSIDSSDGLIWSLHEIARLSGVKMVLEEIPVDPDVRAYADEYRVDADNLALYGGEEYELVLTIPEKFFTALKRKVPSLIRIGTVGSGRGEVTIRSRKSEKVLKPRGWEHFVSHEIG